MIPKNLRSGKTLLTEPDSWIRGCLSDMYAKGTFRRECGMDIGAGNLRHSRMLVKEFGFQKVLAIDIEPTINGLLESEIEVRQIDVKKLDIAPNSQDMVIMWALSHMLPPRQIRELLESVRRGLRSGGMFLGTFLSIPEGVTVPQTSYPQAKIEAAFKGLSVGIAPVGFTAEHPMSRIPGATMLQVLVYKE